MKLIHLEKNFEIKVSSIINNYLNPEHVFIPIVYGFDIKVKLNDHILKDQKILSSDDMTIKSPVSGKVIGTKDCMDYSGKMKKCLVIENDFKESSQKRSGSRRIINNLSKEQLITKLKEADVMDCDNQLLPLYKRLIKPAKIETLTISIIDDEPYIASNSFILRQYTSELLEVIDALNDIFLPKNCLLVLKSSDGENIEKLNSLLGTYPKINLKIVPDVYPIGNEIVLNNYLFSKNINHDKTLTLNISNVLAIYKCLKKNRYLSEKIITISGNAIQNPQVFNVKIGTHLDSLIKEHITFKTSEIICIANGLMSGKEVDYQNLVVTAGLNGLIINSISQTEEHSCINCGKCYESCPIKINPKYILDNKDNDLALIKSRKDKCLDCGLCSYICPAKIKLNKYLKGDKYE